MIPTSPTTPVSWPTATAPASAPVPAVMGVAPAAPARRDAQTGPELRRGQARQAERPAATPTDEGADAAEQRREAQAAQAARAERSEQQARQARERAREQAEAVEHLRRALRKVWDASGAVVEQALAREAGQAQPADASIGAVDGRAGASAPRARSLEAYEAPGSTSQPPGLSRRV